MAQRPFDVVVFGATGFTGQLLAEYLGRTQRGLRWAIAGRNPEKLGRVRERLGALDPALAELPTIVADGADANALRSLAAQTTAVVSTAGPFARYGSELVAACVERGAHYCDITGETQWIRRMIDHHHEAAQKRGIRIVHSAGYDSVPSDLGTYVLQRHARELHGMPSQDVHALVTIKMPHAKSVGFSGGTVASLFNLMEEARRDRAVRRVLFDPHGLAPEPRRARGSRHEQRGLGYEARAHVFTAPFVLSQANVRIVHRTNALLDYLYGDEFSYHEAMATGKGAGGAARALGLSLGTMAVQLGAAVPPLAALAQRSLPAPGEGMSEREREGASFAHEFYGVVGGKHLRARFAAAGDPGYGATAKMVGEAALCLALDGDRLRSPGGVLTPAAALGERLTERLRAVGFTISAWTEA